MFLGGVKWWWMLQCERPQGDLVRYDPSTDEFGVLGADGYIRTYFALSHARRCLRVRATAITSRRI